MKCCWLCGTKLPDGAVLHRRLLITTCEPCALIVRAARVTTGGGFASRSATLRQLRERRDRAAETRTDQPAKE